MSVTSLLSCIHSGISLAELKAAALVKLTADGIAGERVIMRTVDEADLTPAINCEGGHPTDPEEIERLQYGLTSDGKVARVFYVVESTP